MVRGDPADQERAVARALDAGVNYFDTAALYGNGESERNLGRLLKKLRPANAIIGTKVRLTTSDLGQINAESAALSKQACNGWAWTGSTSSTLHNPITATETAESLSSRQVLEEVVPALKKLRQQGKVRFLGFTAVGDTEALHAVIDAHVFDGAQITYNILNPSAAVALPPNYPAQDYGCLLDHAQAAGVGAVGIRVLAGGALSGSPERHPVASPPPIPIGSAYTYDADLSRARRLMALVEEGFVSSLHEAAIRFAISHPAIDTVLVGMATPEEFEQALAAVQKGPLQVAELNRLAALQQTFAGEPR
jgi:aryl-alcohol dehydrogenase-like predicted oxidoreductase